MKVREIGEKIGEAEIPLPSKATLTKVRTLTLRLYSIGYIGLLILLLGGMGSQLIRFYNGVSSGLGKAGNFVIAIAVIVVLHMTLKWIIRTYREKINV